MLKEITQAVASLRKTKPLILNLTNYVTMDFMANALLAIGAAPIMTSYDEELEELIQISSCINVNIGTLDKTFILRCQKAILLAKQYQKPIVFDPVGAGASLIRTKTAKDLIKHADIVKGNASEIISLYHANSKSLGVESIHSTSDAKKAARKLAKIFGITVIVSGPIDFITDTTKETEIPFGSALMPLVTGMGCTLTAIIAAFRSVSNDSFLSASIAANYYGLCGKLAEKSTQSPGTFRTIFLDTLYAATPAALENVWREHQ